MNYYSTTFLTKENLHILLKSLYEIKLTTIANFIKKGGIKTFYFYKTKSIEYYLIKRLLYEVKSLYPEIQVVEITTKAFIKNRKSSILIKELSSIINVKKSIFIDRKKIYKENIIFEDVNIKTIKELFTWVADLNKNKYKYKVDKLDLLYSEREYLKFTNKNMNKEKLVIPKEEKEFEEFFNKLFYLAENKQPFKLDISQITMQDYIEFKNKYLSAFIYINADYIL